MAVIAIAHKPDLTVEQVQEIFRKRFEPKYRVEALKGLRRAVNRRHFMVVKNPFVAVSLKLEQSDRATKFVYNGLVPRWWVYAIWFGGLMGFLVWKGLTHEVEELIRTAPEFK